MTPTQAGIQPAQIPCGSSRLCRQRSGEKI